MTLDLSPIWISLKTSLTATIITFFLGIAAARWMVGYQGKAKGLIDGIFTLPLVLPPTVVGFFLLLLCGHHGPIRHLLPPGVTLIFSWPGAVIAATVVAFPLMYKTTLGGFEQIDTNLLHAARTLGASEWTVFWLVTLPLAWPGIVAGTILAFARALGEFGATLMLAGNIPGKTQTIPVAIFFAAEGGEMHKALYWVLVIVAISLAVIAALNYWSQEKRWFIGNRLKIWGLEFLIHLLSKFATLFFGSHRQQEIREVQTRLPGFLQVEIQKQIPGFALEMAFTTGNDPLGLLGASGSGKSMTLRCLAGLETPTKGRIVLNGRTLYDSERGINLPSRRRRIGFLFQNYALFPHMTVAQNIAFGLQYGRPSGLRLLKAERDQRVADKIALVQLQGLENRYPHQLSGGQQQRVALARALAIEPEALLLDEPFSALDTHLRSQIEQQLIETLSSYQGVTLFVTHNLEEAYRVGKNLLVVSDGRTHAYGSKTDIFERPATFTVAQLTGCKNFSRIRTISPTLVEALDWGCTLHVIEPIPSPLAYVGIRAHHLMFTDNQNQENTFSSWLVQTSETPHRMTLYLKLHSPPTNLKDHHLQVEVFKEKWTVLKDRPFPWQIHLEPLRLFLMSI
jgi:molybdate transport system permease protein